MKDFSPLPPASGWKRNLVLALILILTLVGGWLALAHQMLWTRRMVDLLGASGGAMARVVGCFFFGLAIGAMAGAWLAARVRRPWFWLAGAELALIIACLPVVFLPWWADGVWAWLGPDQFLAWPGRLLQTLFSVGLVLPPAACMGLFLPLAIVGWPPPSPQIPPRDPGLWLYALNTLGAVAGILWVILWLLPQEGVFSGMLWVLGGNFLVALSCLALGFFCPPRKLVQEVKNPPRSSLPPSRFLAIAALSGFLVLGVEVIAILQVQLLAPLSLFAPAVILAVFIGLLALAGFCIALCPRRWILHDWTLSIIPLVAGLLLLTAPFLFHLLAPFFSFEQDRSGLWSAFLILAGFCGLVFGPAIFVAGLWFPAMARSAEDAKNSKSAERWGWLLAANGLGGWLGAELAYTSLLPSFGLFGALASLAFVYYLCSWVLRPARSPKLVGVAWALIGVLIIGINAWLVPTLPSVHPQLAPHVVAQSQGRDGALAVLDHPELGRALLVQNQYILGSTRATRAQRQQAEWPLDLHPDPKSVAFLGVATGITPGAALLEPRVESIIAVEISPQVVAAAEKWFAEENLGLLSSPRATVVVEDARTWLTAQKMFSFDVIVSDLFLPWGPGDGRLYTLEHFSAAQNALKNEGLFALWLPLYQLTNDQAMVILRTFLEVFGQADLMLRDLDSGQPVLGLLGWKNHPPETNALREKAGQNYLGRIEADRVSAPINTLGNLWVEWNAGNLRLLRPKSAPYLQGQDGYQWAEELRTSLQN